jgi:hypothetical protein
VNYYNPYVRVQTYYSWLINDKYYTQVDDSYDRGITLARLHEITNIPISVVRHDFSCMFEWQSSISLFLKSNSQCMNIAWNTILTFDDESEDYIDVNKRYHLELLYENLMEEAYPPKFEALLTDGILDNVPIYIENCHTTYQLSMSPEESKALQSHILTEISDLAFMSKAERNALEEFTALRSNIEKIKNDQIPSYDIKIKDSYLFTRQYVNLNTKLELINKAITDHKCLKIRYKNSKGIIRFVHIKPLKIAYDADENLYSVLSVHDDSIQVHRLDHILSIDESHEIPEPQNEALFNIYPNVWGNCFSDSPEHVKVKFYNEANVWNKVRKELAYRTNGKLYEDGEFLYYEDIVYGISKFRSWIYGYGSSAIVLEPQSLRQHIIESLKARLAQD